MSQENVEVVRAWLGVWVEWFDSPRDPDRLSALARHHMAEDVTYEEDPVWPDAGTYHGLDAVVRRSRSTSTSCTSQTWSPER